MELDFKCNETVNNVCVKSKPKVDWLSPDADDIKAYTSETKNTLAKVSLDFDLMTCTNSQCNNAKHKHTICEMYCSVLHALEDAKKILMTETSTAKFKPVPGWNDYVKESHCDTREAFLMWRSQGKSCFGPVCELMTKTKAKFKHCLHYCKSIEDKAKTDGIAKKVLLKDNISFWKDVNCF